MPAAKPHSKRTSEHQFDLLVPEGTDEAAREEYAIYVWERKIEGLKWYEIAESVKEHFKLQRVPTRQTIYNWLNLKGGVPSRKIRTMREDYIEVTMGRMEAIVSELMPILTDPNLRIRRVIGQGASRETIIDEVTITEKVRAALGIMKAEDHIRKVLNVGASGAAGAGEDGASKESTVNFITQIIQQGNIQNNIGDALVTGGNAILDSLDEPFLTSSQTK